MNTSSEMTILTDKKTEKDTNVFLTHVIRLNSTCANVSEWPTAWHLHRGQFITVIDESNTFNWNPNYQGNHKNSYSSLTATYWSYDLSYCVRLGGGEGV